MAPTNNPDATVHNERVLAATPEEVFDAFEQPDRLARWWGPTGFTNTFSHFAFVPGGRWVFVMHGPDGVDHPNENIFREISRPDRLVIEHVPAPWFRLTVSLTREGDGTRLCWDQEFDGPETAARVRSFCWTANEQVLDRLEEELAGDGAAGRGGA